jgi:pectate lyase C
MMTMDVLSRKIKIYKKRGTIMKKREKTSKGHHCTGPLVWFVIVQLLLITGAGYALNISSTIRVEAGQTYDGGGQTIYASGMGDGSQDEGQDPIFRLAEGATLRNVRIGAPGCDGVHCYGNNLVENVVWEDVGEDALTVKGDEDENCGTITVRGCSASHADDKVFQINAPCTFRLENVRCDDFGKVIRQNGGTTFQVIIYIDDCTFTNGDECIARTDSSSTQLYYSNMSVSNVPTLWKFPSESQIHGDGSATPGPTDTPAPTAGPAVLQPGVTTTIQAEDVYYSNADVESEHSGYSGSGYVNFVNESGGYIEWNVTVNSSTQAGCAFIYANGGDSGRPVEIRVNGNVAVSNLDFPATGAWTTWSRITTTINLNSGANVIRLTGTGSEGGPNVDRMEITAGGSETPAPTGVPTSPPTGAPEGMRGDVNGDGQVNIVDALLIAQYYVGLNPSGFNYAYADTNCDNTVTIVDALLVAQYSVGLINQFC